MRTAAGQRQSFEQPLSHAVACCDKPRGSDRVRSMGQKKVRARKRGRAKTQTIGTFSPGLYILYFLKLPAPPRADLSGIVYNDFNCFHVACSLLVLFNSFPKLKLASLSFALNE